MKRLFTLALLVAAASTFTLAQDSKYQRFLELTKSAPHTYSKGDPVLAAAQSKELLELAKSYPRDWNYGNAHHVGHVVLGRIAADAGRLSEAKAELLASVSETSLPYGAKRSDGEAATPWKASPTLDSFGPDMSLARVLLRKGESDVVAKYLELCSRFWKNEEGRLNQWRGDISAKKLPEFGANLVYVFTLEPRDAAVAETLGN